MVFIPCLFYTYKYFENTDRRLRLLVGSDVLNGMGYYMDGLSLQDDSRPILFQILLLDNL